MIPQTTINNTQEIIYPSKTYRLNFDTKRITGYIDDKEAIVQAIRKIINTEKFAYVIYTNYGIELDTLLGQDFEYIENDIERRLIEAFSIDDRILNITDLVLTKLSIDSIAISFTINTIEGNIDIYEII
jgi:hypothetical protein